MKTNDVKVIEEITLQNGLEIDLEEGWKKLISRQFGGEPSRGFSELIQNYIDSYDASVPMDKRKGEINSGPCWISIRDYGSGLDRKKLKLITTVGATDKYEDSSKIGKFGIGFISIFNPKLNTSRVVLTTICEGKAVEFTYNVIHPEKRPVLNMRILDRKPDYSTCVMVYFNTPASVQSCLQWAELSLRYYPCPVTINGKLFVNEWDHAQKMGFYMFKNTYCSGFIVDNKISYNISLLCKYEIIQRYSLNGLLTGGYNMTYDLRDYETTCTPFIPHISIVINCDSLNLTISRDSFYMDSSWKKMTEELSLHLLRYLNQNLEKNPSDSIIVANQFILRSKLKRLLDHYRARRNDPTAENQALLKLLHAKIYAISNRKEKYSLLDISKNLSKDLPLFYSPEKLNVRWLGGEFRHDFIVLPEPITLCSGAPGLYKNIFQTLFGDSIDLDTVSEEQEMLNELINRKIIDKKSLTSVCRIIGPYILKQNEAEFLEKINQLLLDSRIKAAIEENLHLPVKSLRAVFFDLNREGTQISSGLFEETGKAIDQEYVSNFLNSKKNNTDYLFSKNNILLGLRLKHPFIQYLLNCNDQHIAYYTLTYLASELALCQKILVPYSPMHHFVKHKLIQAMRNALINRLTDEAA